MKITNKQFTDNDLTQNFNNSVRVTVNSGFLFSLSFLLVNAVEKLIKINFIIQILLLNLYIN